MDHARDSTARRNVNNPSSSTFRRLPNLAKTPFRRDKSSTPPGGPPLPHQRTSTFPSLSTILVDDSSVSSAFFDPEPELSEHQNTPAHLLPPSRSSSLSPSPALNDAPSVSPFPNKSTSAMSTPDIDPLEPITYPSHLAQTRPPESSPTPGARSTSRQRDFTMGTGATILLGNVHGISPQTGSGSAMPTSAPDPGGPPSGVPQRKESISASQETADDRKPRPLPTPNGADRQMSVGTSTIRQREETDSGEDTARRRRANTRSHAREPPNSRRPSTTIKFPSLPSGKTTRAPASSMYFSPLPSHGRPPHQALRAHTGTLVGERIWFLGGVDSKNCWRGTAWFDTESQQWSAVETSGESLPPLRAHTTTLVGDKLYVFGGGDGPTYSNDVWTFDISTHRFSRPNFARSSVPPPRRAHTTVLYRNFLVVFGGGNGQAALNDVWALDVSDPLRLSWQEWRTRGDVPQKKGYHTANLIGDKMVIFGGSDGHASFADVHILNLQTLTWTLVNTEVKHNRLSHTSTQVGSYLFIIGGHNGQTYAQDLLLFNLVTLQWETKTPRGIAPPGRGYHVALLHDARIFISGGYNGVSVFDDLWVLDLSAGAYLPQVTTFEVDETVGRSEIS